MGHWALSVKAKGVSSEVIPWSVGEHEEAGYRGVELALKTDQEESMMVLGRAVAARREARTSLIESKVRVPKSNPQVERAVRKWRGQVRKLKLHLKDDRQESSSGPTSCPMDGVVGGRRCDPVAHA